MLEIKKFQINPGKMGLSHKGIEEHMKLYEGYVKKTNEIREKLLSADKSSVNAVYSEYAELKRQESFVLNGARLHEIYFGTLFDEETKPEGKVYEMILQEFGSYDKWTEEMTASGLGARGWAITAYDDYLKKLCVVTTDSHNIGPVFDIKPLIVLDMYEHAYFMDYGTDKKSYIKKFFENLNWKEIDKLF